MLKLNLNYILTFSWNLSFIWIIWKKKLWILLQAGFSRFSLVWMMCNSYLDIFICRAQCLNRQWSIAYRSMSSWCIIKRLPITKWSQYPTPSPIWRQIPFILQYFWNFYHHNVHTHTPNIWCVYICHSRWWSSCSMQIEGLRSLIH